MPVLALPVSCSRLAAAPCFAGLGKDGAAPDVAGAGIPGRLHERRAEENRGSLVRQQGLTQKFPGRLFVHLFIFIFYLYVYLFTYLVIHIEL